MFGVKISISIDGITIHLEPFSEDALPNLAKHFCSMKVFMYTQQLFAQTLENEKDWYNKMRVSPNDVVWGIRPEGETQFIGTTGLHQLDLSLSCVSGIIIWDTNWWHRGIATRAHLGRTMYAADYLSRFTIKSHVRADNVGSYKALERKGYIRTGIDPRTTFRQGKFLDTYNYIWFHPERISVLFKEEGGVPPLEYQEGIAKAQVALSLAREVVNFP